MGQMISIAIICSLLGGNVVLGNTTEKATNSGQSLSNLVIQSSFSRARLSFHHEVARGGLLKDVAIVGGLHVFDTMRKGGDFGDGLHNAGHYLTTPAFVFGDLGGALVGSMLGAMIPVPGTGLASSFLRRLFPMAGAFVLANLAAEAIHLHEEGHFSWKNLFHSIKVGQLIGQIVGATIGSMICPMPLIGTIIGALAGAIVGELLGEKLSGKDHHDDDHHHKGVLKISLVPESRSEEDDEGLSVKASYEKLLAAKNDIERAPALEQYKRALARLKAERQKAALQ